MLFCTYGYTIRDKRNVISRIRRKTVEQIIIGGIMKKSGFIIGSIEIILGLLSLLVTSVIREIIPKLASICSMFNTRDFFEGNYIVSFGFANIISICLCLIGLLTIVYFAFNKKDTECVLTSRPPQFRCSYYWQVTNVQSVFLVFSMLLPSLLRE